MSLVDTYARTLQIKVVFYGPGLCGKTTNLEQLSHQLNPERTGDLMVLDTTGDRTLFFDWMPVELGKIRSFDVKIQLYTVPGQVRYNNTRKQVLAGVDGIVFVVDSQAEAMDQNQFSLQNLRDNLAEHDVHLEDLPLLIQYNKRDLPSALPVEQLARELGLSGFSFVESVASSGQGVLETLRRIVRLTLQTVKEDLDPSAETLRHSHPDVPMDGHALLERIMSGEGSRGGAEVVGDAKGAQTDGLAGGGDSDGGEGGAEAASSVSEGPAADSMADAVQDVMDAESSYDAVEVSFDSEAVSALDAKFEDRMGAVEGMVQGLQLLVDELVAQVKKRADGQDSLVEKLAVVQRVASSLGGRVAGIERRLGRLERQDESPQRVAQLDEMSQLLAELARVLADQAATWRSRHIVEGAQKQEGSR